MATSRGVRQDFPLRNDISISKVNIKSGFVKPTNPVLTHPETIGVALTDANLVTNPVSLMQGYYFESVPLTAPRTLTLPTAASITSFLITTLKSSVANIPGSWFIFTLNNTQASIFTRTLLAGVGVTLQGAGFDLSPGEIASFVVYVNSSTTVTVSRSNLGPSTVETLAETLVAGNVTGGTDIAITPADSITGTGQIPIVSTQSAATAILIDATTGAGGLDINTATGGVAVDSTGAVSLDAAASSNFSTTTGILSLASTDVGAGVVSISSSGPSPGAVAVTSAAGVDVDATTGVTIDAGGGISIDAGASSNFSTTAGTLSLASTDVGAGVVSVTSSGPGAGAVTVTSTGGVDMDSGALGTTIDSGGTISLGAAITSDFTIATGRLSLETMDGTGAGIVALTSAGTSGSAIQLTSTGIGGGIDMDYEGTGALTIVSGLTTITTHGTAALPDLTVNNGNLVFLTTSRGIVNGPSNGTVAADAVIVAGTAGTILDSGVIGAGASRTQIAVAAAGVAADSQVFIQVSGDATAAQSASLLTNAIVTGVGTFTLDVFNTDGANATTGTPSYHFLVVNPA